jgi:TraM recognition site of TraD and TraG
VNTNPEKNTNSKALQRPRLNLVPVEDRYGLGGKVIGTANAGPRVRVGISLADCRHHIHVCGPTGTGKTVLLENMIRDDVEAGRGVAAFDPAKGDLIRDLLDVLPSGCGDRLVIVDPDETKAPPAINLLDPAVHGGSPHDVAAHITSVMGKVWSRWWGDRMTEFAYHGLLTLAYLPGSTLAHLPRLLSDAKWRAGRVEAVLGRLGAWEAGTLAEFWEGFNALPAGQRAGLVAPLMSRLRLVLAHPLASGLFGVPAATFSFADILDGGVLLCRLPKGILGEDGTRLVGSLLVAGLWQATAARARIPEDQRPDATVVLDEAHNFLHMPIGVDDALAEARGLHTSFVLAHQYMGQLSREMAEAIDANARNKVYFALAPKDAIDQSHHVKPWLDDGDLMRLGGYEIVLRPVAAGRAARPVTADTLPPPQRQPGRAEQLRQAARRHTGLSQRIRRRLLADALTQPAVEPGNSENNVEDNPVPTNLVGINTFPPANPPSSRARRGERPREGSAVPRNDTDRSGDHTPLEQPIRARQRR